MIRKLIKAVAANTKTTVENWMRKRKLEEYPECDSGAARGKAAKSGTIGMLMGIVTTFTNNVRIMKFISITSFALYMIDNAAKKAGLNRSGYLVKKALA